MRALVTTLILVCLPMFAGCRPPEPSIQVVPQLVDTNVLFIGSSAVNDDIAWFSGALGTYAFTTDGGASWTVGRVPGADSLQFRDVGAFDGSTAFLLSSGTGTDSRIYHTTDGGQTWELQWTNPEPEGFFDCIDFWDRNSGLLYGDSIDGMLMLFRTSDAGQNWTQVDPSSLPEALPGEGGFASSGTCLRTLGDSTAWIGTGAGTRPRVLRTDDRGMTWDVFEIAFPSGSQAGVFSISFRDALNGIAVGGDLQKSTIHSENIAVTNDGGRTWTIAGEPVMTGVLYGSSWVPGAATPSVVITGPSGADLSVDNGMTWSRLDTLNYWTTAFASPQSGWIAGTDGKIRKVVLPR